MKRDKHDIKLKNHSQVYSLNRLSNPDVETVSSLTAGGDKSYLKEDIDDKNSYV